MSNHQPASQPLTYTLVITGAPYVSQAPQSALDFARALHSRGHRLQRVFLYGDGVLLASCLNTPPSDESHWTRLWCDFLQTNSIRGIACIASALRRGLIDEREQARYGHLHHNLATPFELAGLGEWVEALNDDHRVVYFHGSD